LIRTSSHQNHQLAIIKIIKLLQWLLNVAVNSNLLLLLPPSLPLMSDGIKLVTAFKSVNALKLVHEKNFFSAIY
jgi:hypothetical protein